MKNFYFLTVILLFLYSCNGDLSNADAEIRVDGACPEGDHQDEVIPIVYGFPTEETFQKADSGLVVLGGCEMPEKPKKYYCKKHQQSF